MMVTFAKHFDRLGRVAMSQSCLYTGPRRTPPALLIANSRLGKFFPDVSMWLPEGHVSQSGLLGSDGASLRWTVDAFVDPIGYKGGINLYEYVGDSPLNETDALGLYPGTLGHGSIISPESSVELVTTIRRIADASFDSGLAGVWFKRGPSVSRNAYRLATIALGSSGDSIRNS